MFKTLPMIFIFKTAGLNLTNSMRYQLLRNIFCCNFEITQLKRIVTKEAIELAALIEPSTKEKPCLK